MGDIHTATLSFDADATYTWSLCIYRQSLAIRQKTFAKAGVLHRYDKACCNNQRSNPGSVNNNSGNMSFVIECTDTNLEYFSPVLTVGGI